MRIIIPTPFQVSKDMEEIHAVIGLPLKATYTSIQTDPEILKKLGKENDKVPTYAFLGISWNLKKNSILPLTYFNLSKKIGGQSGIKKLVDMEPAEYLTPEFRMGICRRILSRLTAQCYDRVGHLLGPLADSRFSHPGAQRSVMQTIWTHR